MLSVGRGVLPNQGVVVVCELSGESRFSSMVRESSMELDTFVPRWREGSTYGSLRCCRLIKVWGKGAGGRGSILQEAV